MVKKRKRKMDKKTQKILLFVGIGIVAYMWWKKNQETSEFSNARGRKLKRIRSTGRTEQGWGHPSFIKVCEDAGGTYSGDTQGNGNCSDLPPSAPNPLPRPLIGEKSNTGALV